VIWERATAVRKRASAVRQLSTPRIVILLPTPRIVILSAKREGPMYCLSLWTIADGA
jgi:hypothetical protein